MKKNILLILLTLLSACSTINKNTAQLMEKETDCSTSQRDVKILEEEKASVGKQVLSGVRSILPVAVVAGLLMGDYSDRIAVTTGKYNSDIDAKISEIKKTCGL